MNNLWELAELCLPVQSVDYLGSYFTGLVWLYLVCYESVVSLSTVLTGVGFIVFIFIIPNNINRIPGT